MNADIAPPRPTSVHFVDPNLNVIKTVLRSLQRKLAAAGKTLDLRSHASIREFQNAVAPHGMPDAIVCNNMHEGLTGLDWAAKLRREGYAGKIYIFTGQMGVQATASVDGVFEKPEDLQKLFAALISLA